MRKQLEDFLIDLSEFFPIPSSKNFDKVISLSVEYLIQFCAGKEIDFKKALHTIFDRYKFKGFPDLSLIKECLLENEIQKYRTCDGEGELIVVTMPNDVMYAFELTPFGKPLEEIKKQIIANYGNVKIKTYPKRSVLVGREVIIGGE